jgi:hypothetical protein
MRRGSIGRESDAGRGAILDQADFVRQLAGRCFLEARMRKGWLGALCMIACAAASSSAYAGTKHIHNMDTKAQCIAKADADNLTGHERHAAIKQCRENGSFFSHSA